MDAKSKIKEIKGLIEISELMKNLEISDEGLSDLEQMKERVIDEIEKSQKEAKWSPGQAFSQFSVARLEDITKREKLHKIYEKAEKMIEKCEHILLNILKCHFGFNVKEEIARKKDLLQKKEYVLLFAGETSSGKSSLINLILAEDFLPHAQLPVTSTICEIRYGSSRKFIIHYKNVNKEKEEIDLLDPAQGKSYIDQLSPYLRQEKDRDKGSQIEKIELIWSHELLKDGIVIVDSPGIGENEEMDKSVAQYFNKAFLIIYVINSHNAGGVSHECLKKLLKPVREQSGETFVSEGAVFVCNKWDLTEKDPEKEKIVEYINEQLKPYWPGLDCQSQVVKLSTSKAIAAQNFGMILPQFRIFIQSVKSMMLKAIISRLEKKCQWIDSILSRTHFHTTMVMRNEQQDNPIENFMTAKLMLEVIKSEYEKCIQKLERKLEYKTEEAVEHLVKYLKSPGFEKKFTTWSDNECPERELTAEVEKKVDQIIKEKFEQEIDKWEAENKSIRRAHDSLMKRLQKYSNHVEFEIKKVEKKMSEVTPSDDAEWFSISEKVALGLTSPIWFPVALVGGILSLPVLGGMAVKNLIKKVSAKNQFKNDKKTFIAQRSSEYLKEHVSEDDLRPRVAARFDVVRFNIKKMKDNFAKLIEADSLVIGHVLEHTASLSNAAEYYAPINADCNNIRGELSIFTIKEIIPRNINITDLQWSKDTIGSGTFADVFKGSLKTTNGKCVNVAVKVCKDMLTERNAHDLLCEELILRSINHENVVKFYGPVLKDESGGTKFIFVMELCDESLRMYIEKQGDCLPGRASGNRNAVRQTLKWGKDIACGLEYLHNKKIVHRDLKPDNILIAQSDRKSLKIADVGIATNEKDVTGTVVGTPLYMAPEIFSDSGIYDSSADIYSFGLILWELWYGQRVFSECFHRPQKLMADVRNGLRPHHIKGCHPMISKMETIMQKCWETDPKDRLNAVKCVEELKCTLEWWNKAPK